MKAQLNKTPAIHYWNNLFTFNNNNQIDDLD